MRDRFAASMPWPVSATAARPRPAGVVARGDRAAGDRPRLRIACSALSIRFSSACCSWPPSASTVRQAAGKSVVELDAVMRKRVRAQREHAVTDVGDVLRRRARPPDGARRRAGCGRSAPRVRIPRRCAADRAPAPSGGTRGSRGVAQLLLDQLRVADHAGQRVVQLVRDAGDELADCRQLLRLDQLRLRRLQLLERGEQPARWSWRARCSSPAAGARRGSPR